MKGILYLIHIPAMIIGAIAGTLWVGFYIALKETIDWWQKDGDY